MQTLGNHEFDHQIEGVVPFLESIQSPVIVCNIDDSEEPTMQGKYQKSIIIDKYDRKIGIVGVILSTTNVKFIYNFNCFQYHYRDNSPADNCQYGKTSFLGRK